METQVESPPVGESQALNLSLKENLSMLNFNSRIVMLLFLMMLSYSEKKYQAVTSGHFMSCRVIGDIYGKNLQKTKFIHKEF